MPTLNFTINNNSGIPDENVFIGFWGTFNNATITTQSNGVTSSGPIIPIGNSPWYKKSDIISITMEPTTTGRIYIAYNGYFEGGLPSYINPTDPYHSVRYDFIELTFDGTTSGVADLSAMDSYSIPMSLATLQNNQLVDDLYGVKEGCSMIKMYTDLVNLSNPAQSLATANMLINDYATQKNPIPQGIQDQMKAPASGLVTDSSGNFVRIIGADVYPSFGDPSTKNYFPGLPFTPYDTFLDYFNYMIHYFGPGTKTPTGFSTLGNGKIAHLTGQFNGTKGLTAKNYLAQTYDVSAFIDNNYNLTITGTGGLVGNITMTVSKWNLLTPSSTYGGNPIFSLNGGTPSAPQNDIYAWILGDFFSGLNIGAICSAAKVGGNVVGEMTSKDWFSQLPQAKMLFDKLWDSTVTNYWNKWAKIVNKYSDAYGFAYAERFSYPQISLNPNTVDTLTLILLSAYGTP